MRGPPRKALAHLIEPPLVTFILTGISFAGKSVLARTMSDVTGLAVVDPDRVGHEMGLGLSGELLSDSQWATIHRESERRARLLLREGQSLIYDTTSFTRAQRE